MAKKKAASKLEERIQSAPLMEASAKEGLSEAQVSERKKEGLINKRQKIVTKSYWQILFDNLFNYLNLILFVIFAFMLSAKLTWSHYFFLVILIANIALGLIQDLHARHLVDKLRVSVDPKAKVIRGGAESEIPADEIVLSDIMVLSTGDSIPADCMLLEGALSVDESLLTGECEPINKVPGETLYSGTFITKGKGRVRVTAIGSANYSETVRRKATGFHRPKSEIKSTVNRITIFCGSVALLTGLATSLYYVLRHATSYHDFVESLSGSMVAMIPTGMFLLTSLTLAVGVIRLAMKRMLVQELYCIEMLARVDVLCVDKTGTLTDGSMGVAEVIPMKGHNKEEIAYMVSAILHFTEDKNTTAAALRAAFGDDCRERAGRVIPFDSASKYSGVSLFDTGSFFFGAYGYVPASESKEAEAILKDYASRGYRAIVVARSDKEMNASSAPKNAEIAGVIALSDHLKNDAKEIIGWFQENDVAVRVISGDDPITVSEIAKQAGILGAEKFVSLAGKSIEETKALANDYIVFGRVSPEQKAALIETIKSNGHKVAMTGDGVNDIIALKVADCSIAMASGSEAARSVAHLVALDSDFSRLPAVVAEGRRVINNLQRTCSLFLCKTVFAILMTLIFAFVSLCGGSSYPFSTSNMIPWEMFSIGIAAFFLALQPSNERLKGSFFENIILKSVPGGLAATMSGALPFVLYCFWPGLLSNNPDTAFGVAVSMSVLFFTLSSYEILFRVCLPPTRYRLIVFFAILACGAAMLAVDGFALHGSLLGLKWDGVYWTCPVILALGFGVEIGLYYAVDTLMNAIAKRRNANHANQ